MDSIFGRMIFIAVLLLVLFTGCESEKIDVDADAEPVTLMIKNISEEEGHAVVYYTIRYNKEFSIYSCGLDFIADMGEKFIQQENYGPEGGGWGYKEDFPECKGIHRAGSTQDLKAFFKIKVKDEPGQFTLRVVEPGTGLMKHTVQYPPVSEEE